MLGIHSKINFYSLGNLENTSHMLFIQTFYIKSDHKVAKRLILTTKLNFYKQAVHILRGFIDKKNQSLLKIDFYKLAMLLWCDFFDKEINSNYKINCMECLF